MTAAQRKTAKPGRPRDPDRARQRRDEILTGAICQFGRHGFDGADVDAIAASLKCAKGTIYNYFNNKTDLFHQCVDFVMRGLLEVTQPDDSRDPLEDVQRAVGNYLTYFHDHPEYTELLILERAVFRDRRRPTYFVYRDSQVERWRAVWQRLIDAGRVRPMPVDRILDNIGDLLYGMIFTNYFAGRDKPLEHQIADALDLILHGLLTPRELSKRGEANR